MKIAIFGGAFNPVHTEHVNMARAAVAQLALDKVIVMPSCISPHKSGKLAASAEARSEMCRLAFADIPQAEVSDYELSKGGVSYSYITCEYLKALYPQDELYFLVGADMLDYFPKWKYPERILRCVVLAACARGSEEQFADIAARFQENYGAPLARVNYVGGNVSSTKIRALAALGESVEGLTDKKVAEYIAFNGVYRQEKLAEVKKFLKPERWLHTLRVAVFAAEHCSRAGVDELTAITAAALHDVAKYLGADSPYLKGFCLPEGVPEPVVHQFAGEYVARNTFGITDENILSAIKYHTSGREDMSPLEKLIFLADMLEEGRRFPGVDELRRKFERDTDECLLAALGGQLKYLKETGMPVYPLTQRAYDYLKGEKNGKY